MRKWKITFSLPMTMFLGVMMLLGGMLLEAPAVHAAGSGGVTLYTPYTNISVTPGESISYSIDAMNNSSEVQDVEFRLEGLPDGWEHQLTSGGYELKQLSVKPNDSHNVSLQLDVPLKVNKGAYSFNVVAVGMDTLPITVNISEQGTYTTELTTDQPNMEGFADSSFNFSVNLKNRTVDKQLYALLAEVPRGWDVKFTAGGKSITSVNVEANASESVSIEITPPEKVAAGSYKFPIKAATKTTSAETELEVVVTGSYDVVLSTPSGLLSTDITAGKEKKVELQVTNNGTADLSDIKLDASTPVDWEVTFDEKEIKKLEAGKSTTVLATMKADDQAIAGDYVVSMSAGTPEVSSDAQFRVAVKTSLLWGWIGILIIAIVIGGIYYLFRAYGRR